MTRSPWPAVRTTLLLVGVPLACAMLPAIYTQNAQDAKDRAEQYRQIKEDLSELKLLTSSHLTGTDQALKDTRQDVNDLQGRVSQLELYKPVYKR